MARYNVECNGKYACFSSVVDDFLTKFMDIDDYEKWRKKEYGECYVSLNMAEKMTIGEAMFRLFSNKSKEYAISQAKKIGVPNEIIGSTILAIIG